MIKANTLSSLVKLCSRILNKTDEQAVIISSEGGLLTVECRTNHSYIIVSEALDENERSDAFTAVVDPETVTRIADGCGSGILRLGVTDNLLEISGVISAKVPVFDEPPARVSMLTDKKYVIPAEWFRQCCMLTPRFCAKERGRYILDGAHFEFDGEAVLFVATDGRKGVCSHGKCEQYGGDSHINFRREYAQTASRVLPEGDNLKLIVKSGESGVVVSAPDVEFAFLQTEGEYPEQPLRFFPEPISLSNIDGKHLGDFSGILDRLDVERAKFVSDGKSLKIYGRSQKVPEIETALEISLEEDTMILSPELMAGAMFNQSSFQFGWGRRPGEDRNDAAVFVSEPFTAIALCMDPQGDWERE